MALSFKELYHRRLRLSLCRSRLSFFTYGGSYLECPCCWIIPLTNNPFATVARMRAPAGSPPGPAGTSSPTLAFQSSAGLRTGSCVSSPRQRLAQAREQGPSEVPLQTQMHQLCQSVCRMWGSPLPLPALRRARVGAQLSSADGKNGGGICMQVFKENRCRATVWVISCACMQIQACLTTKPLRHRGTLPHTACRCSIPTGAGAPAAPHTHISCPPRICVVHLSPVIPSWNLLYRPDKNGLRFNVVFFKIQRVSLVITQQAAILTANLESF